MERMAWMSPDTARNDRAAAAMEFSLPIDRTLAALATTSRQSLAKVAFVQRRRSLTSSDLAAATVPSPSTRSLMPMVRSRSIEAPVGDSRRDRLKKGRGAAISVAPTAARSHPILSTTVTVTGAAYPDREGNGDGVFSSQRQGNAGPPFGRAERRRTSQRRSSPFGLQKG